MSGHTVTGAVQTRVRDSVNLQQDTIRAALHGCKAARVFGTEHNAITRTQGLIMHGIEDKLALALMDLYDLVNSMNRTRASEIVDLISPLVRKGQGSDTMDLHEIGGKLQWVRSGT